MLKRRMSWALVISGIILLAIGIIMIIIGIVLYEQNVNANKTQPWYVWFLIIGGIILGILGGVLLAWGLIARSNASASTVTTTTVYPGQPAMTTTPLMAAPACPPQPSMYPAVPSMAAPACGVPATTYMM